jgi:hypothetical protein
MRKTASCEAWACWKRMDASVCTWLRTHPKQADLESQDTTRYRHTRHTRGAQCRSYFAELLGGASACECSLRQQTPQHLHRRPPVLPGHPHFRPGPGADEEPQDSCLQSCFSPTKHRWWRCPRRAGAGSPHESHVRMGWCKRSSQAAGPVRDMSFAKKSGASRALETTRLNRCAKCIQGSNQADTSTRCSGEETQLLRTKLRVHAHANRMQARNCVESGCRHTGTRPKPQGALRPLPVLCCLHLFSLRLSGTTSLRPQVYHLLYRPAHPHQQQKSYTVQRFFCNVVLRPIFCFGLWFVLQLVGLRSEAHVLFLQGSRVGSPPVLFFRRTCPFDFTFLPNTRALALHPSSFSGTNTICVARVEFGSRPKIDTGCSKSRSGR